MTIGDIQDLETKLASCSDLLALKAIKDEYFGATGIITQQLRNLKTLNLDERRLAGPAVQQAKLTVEKLLVEAEHDIKIKSQSKQLAKEAAVLSTRVPKVGHIHPLSLTIEQMNNFFIKLGYSVYDGPEIETDEFNFQRLNVPKDHPARDMQDTIYIDAPNILLRTHASSIEARALAGLKPPFRVVCPGKVYRNEKPNKSNHFVFHHYQGVVVQEKVSLSELFGTLELLFKHMYGEKVVMRFRSKYYPEVEPGVGPDMRCFNCEGKGCTVCKHVGWIEMAGAGIIHQDILKMAGIDTNKYMGFAFGLGLDRWVMAKFNITDIRTLLGGDVVYPYFEHEKVL